jgi:hypothetical protein
MNPNPQNRKLSQICASTGSTTRQQRQHYWSYCSINQDLTNQNEKLLSIEKGIAF